ncbi:MAG: homoserine dehydrogenase, partial [Candidatus Omnitrophica bacterium]|nr:homoserine dehydrogenase [Candidatus Omnitrophota bacterium]
DPTFDIEGHDTAHKIVLLSELAFGTRVSFEDVYREGITRLTSFDLKMAQELGYRIKLLAVAKRHETGLEVRVHPALVPLDSQIAAVSGVFNAIFVEGDPLGPAMFYGQGAGGSATGAAVVADIMEAARQKARGKERDNYYTFDHQDLVVRPMGESICAYYLKLMLKDEPGVLAQVAAALGEQRVSIASFIQEDPHAEHQALPVVMTTHRATESSMVAALDVVHKLEGVVEEPFLLRIEELEG